MKKLIITLLLTVLSVAVLAACGSDEAANGKKSATGAANIETSLAPLSEPVKIKIGFPTQGISMLPLWVAKDTGILEKYGVNADLIYIAGSPRVQETLNSDGIDVGLTGVEAVGNAKAAGIDSVIFTSLADKIALYMYGSKDIDTSNLKEELKGKTIIAGVEGSLYDYLAQSFVRENGLDPDKDVKFLYMGGEGDRTAAFLKGDADFYLVAPPTSFKMDEMKYPKVHDFSKQQVLISGLVMKTEKYKDDPKLAEILAASLIEANAFIKNNKEETLTIISKWTGIDDKDVVDKTYKINLDTIPDKPYIADESVQFYLDNSNIDKVKAMKPSELIDNSMIKNLDESGFIDEVLKEYQK